MLNYLEFFKICGKLKNVKRTGWIRSGVELPESVSDHMYRMSMFAFSLDKDVLVGVKDQQPIDKIKCMKMSLVHDLGESLVGDFTPDDKITKAEKYQLEKNAMIEITSHLNKEVATEIFNLWQEYEDAQSNEALLVKDFDKFEMVLQAVEYESKQPHLNLQSFFDSTRGKFTYPLFQKLAEKLEKDRIEKIQSK
ncbi:HD domain-containing protein 2 [Tieghemostelium lacteum]|uniref:5'-deoxynucleotidase n=1 Tax=Tieghemostelium lacteum TaxID=361077 RepID=A0A151ZBP6_TIELA|nr:HD domain-containing protein 2 [Tieghemostelium lacteum]|eukprot:KYQ91373.1 HD domain-containing protein 2 [Tieghemostelium lacteum]